MDAQHLLIFALPGFVVVWTFRYFSHSNKKSDGFELFALSFIWGLILLLAVELLMQITQGVGYDKAIGDLLKNLYAASAILMLFAVILGWAGSYIVSRAKFKKLIEKISP